MSWACCCSDNSMVFSSSFRVRGKLILLAITLRPPIRLRSVLSLMPPRYEIQKWSTRIQEWLPFEGANRSISPVGHRKGRSKKLASTGLAGFTEETRSDHKYDLDPPDPKFLERKMSKSQCDLTQIGAEAEGSGFIASGSRFGPNFLFSLLIPLFPQKAFFLPAPPRPTLHWRRWS